MGLDEVLSDLEGEGYAARPFIVPACAADAPHRRDRVWIIARNVENARHRTGRHKWVVETGQDPSGEWAAHTSKASGSGKQSKTVANADSQRQPGSWLHGRPQHQTQNKDRQADRANDSSQGNAQFWLPEPPVGRVANGVPRRVDRLRGLGNAIVPQIAMRIGQTIKAVHDIPAQGHAHNNVNNSNTGENNV